MQSGWFWSNQRETTFYHCSSIYIGCLFLPELFTTLQHWLIVTSTTHYLHTFFQLFSFASPLAHWVLVMKSCLKFLGRTARRLDIALLAIRPLSSGTRFHLQSVSRILVIAMSWEKNRVQNGIDSTLAVEWCTRVLFVCMTTVKHIPTKGVLIYGRK